MRVLSILTISSALGLAACVPVEADGGLTEPYQAGLVQQAQLDGPPVAGAEAARQAEAAQAAAAQAAAAAAEARAAEESRAAAAAELMKEEEAEIARAEAAAAAAGAEVEEVATTDDPEAEAAPEATGELATASPEDPTSAPAGELAGSGAPPAEDEVIVVPPGDPEATPLDTAAAPVEPPAADPAAEPATVGGAEPERGLEVLPPAPTTDAGALAALDRAALRPSPPAPDYATLAAASSEPCSPSGFDATPLGQLKLIQTWVAGTASRALLENPAGETRTVTQGAVVGPNGARVASIGAGDVVFAEIQFGMDGEAVLVQQRLSVAAPR